MRSAVEVLSPESQVRDRGRRPRLYAQAGIPPFWSVEQEGDHGSVVYVYELDPANEEYTNVSVRRSRREVDVLCRPDIDLTRLPRPPRESKNRRDDAGEAPGRCLPRCSDIRSTGGFGSLAVLGAAGAFGRGWERLRGPALVG